MNNALIAVVNDPVDPVDPAIAVSMVGDIVVLSPRGRLDLDATYALVQAVDAASSSDRKVVIDLDGSAELSPAELLFRTEATPPNGVHQRMRRVEVEPAARAQHDDVAHHRDGDRWVDRIDRMIGNSKQTVVHALHLLGRGKWVPA